MKNLRAYFITNMYTAGIHAGIQSAHCLHEMYEKYQFCSASGILHLGNWAREHKTIIVLNGGYQSNLESLFFLFGQNAPLLGLPYAKFHESQEALNGALTCVGIVLPQEVYAFEEPENPWGNPDHPGVNAARNIYGAISKLSLAR
jgi:hypothetical protein